MTTVSGKGWTMHHGDCLDVMSTLGKVDRTITDPPYGLSFRGNEWDDSIPLQWLDHARAIAETVVFTTAPTTMWDYPRPDWICIWHRQAANSRAPSGGFNHWSPCLVYGAIKFPIDVIVLNARGSASPPEIDHPSPKPISLMRWLVTHASREGQVVLDPFAGSGTTGVACLRLGRQFIGIEKDEKYFALACDRLRAEENGSTIQASRAGQTAMFAATGTDPK